MVVVEVVVVVLPGDVDEVADAMVDFVVVVADFVVSPFLVVGVP